MESCQLEMAKHRLRDGKICTTRLLKDQPETNELKRPSSTGRLQSPGANPSLNSSRANDEVGCIICVGAIRQVSRCNGEAMSLANSIASRTVLFDLIRGHRTAWSSSILY